MNARHSFRRFASLAFVMALFALSASSALAQPSDPCACEPEFIIVIGG